MLVKKLIEMKSKLTKWAWIKLIERENMERASAIHVTSAIEAEELQRFGWRLPQIRMIPNGIDEVVVGTSEKISMDVKEIAAEQPLILFLGRISWKKGLERLLNSFALTNRGTLAIVGTDDENLAPRLAQIACDLRITDRVRFLPRTVLGGDKTFLYRHAKVFVLPSYSENFGNSVLEAMQHGVPVVVTPEVGAADVVHQSGGGFVAAGDPEPFAAAIRRLVEDASLARVMGEAGQQHSNTRCAWPTVAEQMEQLYESLRP
jgi:glycosyltransferase involved in cell wall biosynthesis